MKPIQSISAKEWNAIRTKIKTLEQEIYDLEDMLPRALDKNFVQRQIELKLNEIIELKAKTEPEL